MTHHDFTRQLQSRLGDDRLYCIWNGQRARSEVKLKQGSRANPWKDLTITDVETPQGDPLSLSAGGDYIIHQLMRGDPRRHDQRQALVEMDERNRIREWTQNPFAFKPGEKENWQRRKAESQTYQKTLY